MLVVWSAWKVIELAAAADGGGGETFRPRTLELHESLLDRLVQNGSWVTIKTTSDLQPRLWKVRASRRRGMQVASPGALQSEWGIVTSDTIVLPADPAFEVRYYDDREISTQSKLSLARAGSGAAATEILTRLELGLGLSGNGDNVLNECHPSAGRHDARTTLLVHGLPGVGKTAVVEALAAEMRCRLVKVLPGRLAAAAGVDADRALRRALDYSRRCTAPAVVLLLDAVDKILPAHDGSVGATRGETEAALLAEFLAAASVTPAATPSGAPSAGADIAVTAAAAASAVPAYAPDGSAAVLSQQRTGFRRRRVRPLGAASDRPAACNGNRVDGIDKGVLVTAPVGPAAASSDVAAYGSNRVVIVGVTSQPASLHPLARRCFAHEVEVTPPTPAERGPILAAALRATGVAAVAAAAEAAAAAHQEPAASAALFREAATEEAAAALAADGAQVGPHGRASSDAMLEVLAVEATAAAHGFARPDLVGVAALAAARLDDGSGGDCGGDNGSGSGGGNGGGGGDRRTASAPALAAALSWAVDRLRPAVLLSRGMTLNGDGGGATGLPPPRVPLTRLRDVGGLVAAKRAIEELVVWPRRHADAFRRLGIASAGGVLLFGPPGTGKTLLARAAAAEAGAHFVELTLSRVVRGEIGESEKAVTRAFLAARQLAPSIVFIDEFQALFSARAAGVGVGANLTSQLMSCMDDLERWRRFGDGNDDGGGRFGFGDGEGGVGGGSSGGDGRGGVDGSRGVARGGGGGSVEGDIVDGDSGALGGGSGGATGNGGTSATPTSPAAVSAAAVAASVGRTSNPATAAGAGARPNVVVLAATNMPQAVDGAFLRPGRFDKAVYVGLPDAADRREILELQRRRMGRASAVAVSAAATSAAATSAAVTSAAVTSTATTSAAAMSAAATSAAAASAAVMTSAAATTDVINAAVAKTATGGYGASGTGAGASADVTATRPGAEAGPAAPRSDGAASGAGPVAAAAAAAEEAAEKAASWGCRRVKQQQQPHVTWDDDVDLGWLAAATDGYSGADLTALVRNAAMAALEPLLPALLAAEGDVGTHLDSAAGAEAAGGCDGGGAAFRLSEEAAPWSVALQRRHFEEALAATAPSCGTEEARQLAAWGQRMSRALPA